MRNFQMWVEDRRSVEEFRELLRSRGLLEDQIKKAIMSKFGVTESLRLIKRKKTKDWADRVLDNEDKDNESYFKKILEDIKDFEIFLRDKGLSEDQIEKAVLNKFGIFKNESINLKESKHAITKKGKKVPGKYLSGLNEKGKYGSKEAMKKEIDEFRGKDTYKLNWDADYKDGKRIKTKKGKATKAFEKKFGKTDKK